MRGGGRGSNLMRGGSMQRMGSFMFSKEASDTPLTARKMFYVYLCVYLSGAAVITTLIVMFFGSIADDARLYPAAVVTNAPVPWKVDGFGAPCWLDNCLYPTPFPTPNPTP
mmetsp:Transcript_32827/g.67802  ORF Transcript_32827/g.67802 Transcript_32827/m.67802 type:complete len:111 (-) Transcript_32827:80-412(-)